MAYLARAPSYKSITSIPGWLESLESSPDKVNSTAAAYRLVPLIFRALNLRCDSLSSVPIHWYGKGKQEIEDITTVFPNLDVSDLVWKTEASILLTGAAYWLKVQNRVKVINLQWINPFTMSVALDRDGRKVFTQTVGTRVQVFSEDEIVYFQRFNPTSDIDPGTAAAEVSLNDAALKRYMSRFAAHFFEGGAMPALLLGLPPTTSEAERERVENYFKRMWTGIKNAFRVLAIKAGLIDPKIISFPLKDLAMPELSDQAMEGISAAFGIRKSMLGDPANYATAKEDWDTFWKTTVRPSGEWMQRKINYSLKALNLSIEFAFEELDVFQEDEVERSGALNGVMDFLAKCPTFEIFQGVSSDMGYEWTEETLAAVKDYYAKKEERADALVSNLTQAPPPPQPEQEGEDEGEQEGESEGEGETSAAMRADLSNWRKIMLNRVSAGRKMEYDFKTDVIPADTKSAIAKALASATSPEAVRAVFAPYLRETPERVDPIAAELKRHNDILAMALERGLVLANG